MATRIKLRRDTAANWLEQNPILADGETGFETDTRMMKLGDGSTAWADLKYAVTGDLQVTADTIHGDTSVSLSSGLGDRNNWILLTNANNGNPEDPVDAQVDAVAYDSQGNAYLMGYYFMETGTFLQKVSPSGEVLWNNYYEEYASYGFGLTVDKDDNIVMILSEMDSSSNDILLVKLESEAGTILWQKYINSYGDYNDYASCIDTDSQGNIFITGNADNAGPDGNNVAYIAKFSGANGNDLWSKRYDIEGLNSSGTGLTVDPDDNIGIVGGYETGGPTFLSVFKIDGANGNIVWEGRVLNSKSDNGNTSSGQGYFGDIHWGNIQSSDIAADSQGNFYFTFNTYMDYSDDVKAMVVKFNGTTGKTEWARQLNYADYDNAVGSVICDELNNVYVSTTARKYNNNYDQSSNTRATQQITKISATGSIVWQRWLSQQQAETFDGRMSYQNDIWSGQTIRVNDKYVLVCGNYQYQSAYNESSQNYYTQPYVAQLSRDGTTFSTGGWSFTASDLSNGFVSVIRDDNNYEYNSADVTNFGINVTNGDVTGTTGNTDTTNLVYVTKSNVNKVTFTEKTLTLPAGGSVELSREKIGYFSSIGRGFDNDEGWNNQGSVWLNGSARDDAGNTFSAGGWYTYDDWNDWTSYENIPMVFKTDADGKLIWSAGNALDQDYSNADLVDVVYDANTHTVVALGNDGELDGNEGFNVLYLDADTGSMKQDITHIRPGDNEGDIWPRSLNLLSDGTPVVGGYITNTKATYANVTAGGSGLTGSTNSGTLVVALSNFTVNGTTEYPSEDGNWYIYPDAAEVYSVNRFGYDESAIEPTLTSTLGSGATFDITVSGGVASVGAIVNGGSGYKAGHRIKVPGTQLNATSPNYDLYLYVDAVDGDGVITGINGTLDWELTAAADATYSAVTSTALPGTLYNGWTKYNPGSDSYDTFYRNNAGYYYGVGDTLKVLGTALGGLTPENDLTITVTAITGTGPSQGGVDGVTVSGTAQTDNIKLYGGSADYTVTGEYNIVHETNDDAFVWTPNWNKVIGSKGEGYYNDWFPGLTVDSSDNVIVSGYIEDTGIHNSWAGNWQRGVVAKLSSEGELLWAKSLDGSEGNSTVWAVDTDADDNIYSVMRNNSNPYVTKLTPDGDLVWQQSVSDIWSSNAWSLATADNGDVLIAGEVWADVFDDDKHDYNWNVVVVKFDKDGNKLFTRALWSPNGVRFNNNDNYSNQLTIRGDRFSLVGYSNDPGNNDYSGFVADLPLDGTGVGEHGPFTYEEIELDVGYRWNYNTGAASGNDLVTDITGAIGVRNHVFNEDPYIDDNAWRNITIYGDRTSVVQTIRNTSDVSGGDITGVAKIVFEDGSVQTTSMQGLPQVSRALNRNNDYWLRPEDNGRSIIQDNSNTVYIPSPNRLRLPVGFAITIINMDSNSGVQCENDDEYIYLSGDNGNGDYSYEIPSWTMATLVKIDQDHWMIAGSGLSSGW